MSLLEVSPEHMGRLGQMGQIARLKPGYKSFKLKEKLLSREGSITEMENISSFIWRGKLIFPSVPSSSL